MPTKVGAAKAAGEKFVSRVRYGGKYASRTPGGRHGDVQNWLARAEAADATGLPRERMLRGTTSGSATLEDARYQATLERMAVTTGGSRTVPVSRREHYMNRVRESNARARAGSSPRRGGTAPGGAGGGPPTPPPAAAAAAAPAPGPTPHTTVKANGDVGKSDFWQTMEASGWKQHLGMAAVGAGTGAGISFLTGGNVGQGAMFGAAGGVTAAAYNRQIWKGAYTGKAMWSKRGLKQQAALRGKEGFDEKAFDAAKKRYREDVRNKRSTTNAGRAAATAAGAGLASGLMFSGHRRRNVNSYNAGRGNYIGM